MNLLCFQNNYVRRFAQYKEFCHEAVEAVLDDFLKRFCNDWLEEEYLAQTGADFYERTAKRCEHRNGHYTRHLVTSRGVFKLRVPRGRSRYYRFSLFERYKRQSPSFEGLVVESILLGHSSRKAKRFFDNLLGQAGPSHSLGSRLLARFDNELQLWRRRPIQNGAIILVLDAVYLKGFVPHLKSAKPILCAWAVWPDGTEELLDFQAAQGESFRAWSAFCQRLFYRGLKDVRLVVTDDNPALRECLAFFWPEALHQACIFHLLQNLARDLKGRKDKHKILKEASWLFEAQSPAEFERWARIFRDRWQSRLPKHSRFIAHWHDATRFYQLPKAFWTAAKTSNRLERLFKELKRRVKCFSRFQGAASGSRWLYALLVKRRPMANDRLQTLLKSQQYS